MVQPGQQRKPYPTIFPDCLQSDALVPFLSWHKSQWRTVPQTLGGSFLHLKYTISWSALAPWKLFSCTVHAETKDPCHLTGAVKNIYHIDLSFYFKWTFFLNEHFQRLMVCVSQHSLHWVSREPCTLIIRALEAIESREEIAIVIGEGQIIQWLGQRCGGTGLQLPAIPAGIIDPPTTSTACGLQRH